MPTGCRELEASPALAPRLKRKSRPQPAPIPGYRSQPSCRPCTREQAADNETNTCGPEETWAPEKPAGVGGGGGACLVTSQCRVQGGPLTPAGLEGSTDWTESRAQPAVGRFPWGFSP